MSADAKKIIQLSDTIAVLQNKIKELEVENRRLSVRNTIDKEAQKEKGIERKLLAAQNTITSLEHTIRAKQRECDSLTYEVNLLRGVVNLQEASDEHVTAADALAQVASLQVEVAQLTARCNETESMAAEYYNNYQQTLNEAQTMKAQILALQNKIKEVSEESSLLRDLQAKCDRLEQMTARERKEADQSKGMIEDLQRQLQKERDAHQRTSNELITSQKEVESVKRTWHVGYAALESAQQQLIEANTRAETLEESLRIFRNQEKSLMDVRETLESTESQRIALSEKLKVLNEDLSSERAKNKDLSDQNHVLKNEFVSLQSSSSSAQTEAAKLKEVFAKEKDIFSAQLRYHQDRNQVLEQTVSRLEAQHQQLMLTNERYNDEILHLTEELRKVTEKLALTTVLPTTKHYLTPATTPQSRPNQSATSPQSSGARHDLLMTTPSPQRARADGSPLSVSASKKLEQLLGFDSSAHNHRYHDRYTPPQ